MKVTPIHQRPRMANKIDSFLRRRGLVLGGASIVEEDGHQTLYVGVERRGIGTYSDNLVRDLKEVLGVETLVLDGEAV